MLVTVAADIAVPVESVATADGVHTSVVLPDTVPVLFPQVPVAVFVQLDSVTVNTVFPALNAIDAPPYSTQLALTQVLLPSPTEPRFTTFGAPHVDVELMMVSESGLLSDAQTFTAIDVPVQPLRMEFGLIA